MSDTPLASLTLTQWPAGDQIAWTAALAEGDDFDPGGLAATWKPVTRAGVATSYGCFLQWLAAQGKLDPAMAVAVRITSEVVVRYAEYLCTIGATSSAVTYVSFLVMALRAMAPGDDWAWVQQVARRLKFLAVPVRDKRPRLQATVDLVIFGIQLMEQADREGEVSGWQEAVDYRDGLMIALQALRPLRRRTFIAITLGQHLLPRGEGHWMVFEGADLKTGGVLEMPSPEILEPYLARYLTRYRPWLCAQTANRDPRYAFKPAGQRLWVSKTGAAYGPESYCDMVSERTAAHFGTSLSPHLFRDCAASSIANENPEEIRIIMSILGHSTMKSAEDRYIHAQTVVAAGKHQNHIMALRAGAKARQRRGGGTSSHSET